MPLSRRTLCYLFQCSQSQSTDEKHINGKNTKKGDLEKKIDLDDADIFDKVNNGSDNEDLHILKQLGKTHSLGVGKVFKANNKATVLKIDIPKNVQNLDIVETNNGELAFGYDYTNVFANLLAKFNQYCCFKFFYNYVKKKTQENGGHQNLLLRPNA